MNKHVKGYLYRGLIFGGFGPIVTGIVFCFIHFSGAQVVLSGAEIFIAIVSTYFLAFIQAGASIFNQMEEWSVAKSMGIHFLSLYIAYVACYLVNRWIPFSWEVVAVFTGIFIVGYLAIWLTVALVVWITSKNLNKKLNEKR